jgi:hypothetical protein
MNSFQLRKWLAREVLGKLLRKAARERAPRDHVYLPTTIETPGLASRIARHRYSNRHRFPRRDVLRDSHVDLHHAGDLSRSAARVFRVDGLPADGHSESA